MKRGTSFETFIKARPSVVRSQDNTNTISGTPLDGLLGCWPRRDACGARTLAGSWPSLWSPDDTATQLGIIQKTASQDYSFVRLLFLVCTNTTPPPCQCFKGRADRSGTEVRILAPDFDFNTQKVRVTSAEDWCAWE